MSTLDPGEPPQPEAAVVEQVEARIDRALAANRKREILVISVILVLLLVGVGLMFYAAAIRYWPLSAPGGALQLFIIIPLRRLIKLREDAMRLQIVPQLLRLAETKESQRLAAKFVDRLIEQVK